MTLARNLRAAWKLIRITLASMMRDKSTLFWSFVFPALLLMGLGFIWGRNAGGAEIPVGLVGPSDPALRMKLRHELAATRLFRIVEGSQAKEMAALKAGERHAVLVCLPAGPASSRHRWATGGPPVADVRSVVATGAVRAYYDPRDEVSVQLILASVRAAVAQIDRQMTGRPVALQMQTVPIRPRPRSHGNPISNFVAAIIAMMIIQGGLGAAVALVSERQKGYSDVFRLPPVSTAALMSGSLAARVLITWVQAMAVVAAGVLAFGVSVQGSWWALAFLVVLGTLAFTAIGEALAMLAPNVEAISGIVSLVSLPMIFLSGLFSPIDSLPGAARTFALALPSSYLGDGLRWAMSGVASVAPFTVCTAILVAWAMGSVLFAIKFYRWE